MEITCSKRKLSSTLFGDSKRAKLADEDGNEKNICKDVLESIFQRLNFRDFARAKLVCSHWLSTSKYVENHVPWLLVPDKNNLCLFNVEEKESFNMQNNAGFDFSGDSCYVVGSSHGCIIYLDEDLLPVVLNPLTGSRIQLPQLLYDDCIVVKKDVNGDYFGKEYLMHDHDVLPQHWLRAHIVHKVILSSNPFKSGKKCSVALIYGPDSELAYFNMEDDHSWTRLDKEKNHYTDIIFHENKLYALERVLKHVEVWDFSGDHPKKLMKLNLSIPTKSCKADDNFFGYSDGWKYYLVESRGKILLITRGIADNLDENGNVVFDPDSYPNETNHPLIFPYGTVAFSVFGLDMLKKQWIQEKSLDGCALFLGGNHSLSISVQQDFVRCKENSIYFTDDNWERMEEDYTYGGHDMGVFNLSDGKVRIFHHFSRDRIQPSPCWIVPEP